MPGRRNNPKRQFLPVWERSWDQKPNRGRSSYSRTNRGMELRSVVRKLNEFAPLNLAESWDNVGLLVEPPNMRSISKLLLTNDLTLAVMNEAEEKQVEMILSYHPPIFKALKTITTKHWKERIVGSCLAKGIAVYSPHTSYDAIQGGVNDWLISPFGKGTVSPIHQSYSSDQWSHRVQVEFRGVQSDNAGSVERLCTELEGKGGKIVGRKEDGFSMLCNETCIIALVRLRNSYGIDCVYDITKLEKAPILDHGIGRSIVLDRPLTLKDAVEATRKHLRLSHVRLAIKHGGTTDDIIRTVSVCAGSGISVLRNRRDDLLLTGEMSHHDVLDLAQKGSSVILTEHSNCERGFLADVLQQKLTNIFQSKVEVIVSEKDVDPLVVV